MFFEDLLDGLSTSDQTNEEIIANRLAARSLEPSEKEVALVLRELEDECIFINGDVYSCEYEEAIKSLQNPEVTEILRANRLDMEERNYQESLVRAKRRLVGAGAMAAVCLGSTAAALVCPPLLVVAGVSLLGSVTQVATLD